MLAVALTGCSYVGSAPSPTPETQPTPTAAAASPTAGPTGSRPTDPTVEPTATPDYLTRAHAQADLDLQRWADFMADKPANAVVFVWTLYHGGGWHGRGAGDRKEAFLSGQLEATTELSNAAPNAGTLTWQDGSSQTVELISAAQAFDDMVADIRGEGGPCGSCPNLQVTGAHLTTTVALTWRGKATVPAWQFEFVDRDVPLTPITYVAAKDAIDTSDWGNWGRYAADVDGVYGTPSDTQITVLFGGGACDTSHSIEAVESELAIVPIISATGRGGVCIAMRVGYALVLELAQPLGNRAVLDLENGWPAPVYPEVPPNWPTPGP